MTIASGLETEPCASTTEATRPSTISEKYSAGPKFKRHLGSGGANRAISSGGDGAGEEGADRRSGERHAGAAPARHLVAVEGGHHRRGLSPGRLIRMAVVEPPYCAP
jgi:hypothetical protein